MLRLLKVSSRFSRIKYLNGSIKRINKYIRKKHINRIICRKEIQVVYCTYEIELLKLLLDSHINKFKIVMRMAGMHWYEQCIRDPSLIRKWEEIFNRIDAVNYVSVGQKQMVENKFKELKMHVNFKYSFHADIGTILANNSDEYSKEKDNKSFTMIMASRFSGYQKRQDIIVRAVSLINPDFSINVKLIGSGRENNNISNLIETLNVEDRITLIPFMNQNDLWQELRNADLLCHACDYEGTSKIILESMALGLPVLASSVTPINDYIIEGYNGFLVDNEPVLWAKRIEEIMNDEPLRLKVSQNSRKYVAEHHNPAKNVKLYEKEFRKIENASGYL